jgi:hypothetical protein
MTQPMTLQELQRQIDEPPYHQFLRPVAVSIDPQAGDRSARSSSARRTAQSCTAGSPRP